MAEQPVEFNDARFEDDVLASRVPVLVDFWAPWCAPCRAIGPVVEEIAREFSPRVVVGKLNVDQNRATAMRFDVRSIPTLILFREGKIVERIVGVTSKAHLAQVLGRESSFPSAS